jgi:hypothetical protein
MPNSQEKSVFMSLFYYQQKPLNIDEEEDEEEEEDTLLSWNEATQFLIKKLKMH